MKKLYKTYLKIVIVILILMITMSESLQAKEPIFQIETDKKEIALTFDINWAEKEYLYDILNILEKYKIKSTFFIMGKWIIYPEENEQKLKDIHKLGHEIGNHSYVHPNFTEIDESRIKDEVIKTEVIIKDLIGVKTKLFRYPSGYYNEECEKIIENIGYTSIQWDVDSIDWQEEGVEIEYERVINKVKNGSIVLFHNNAKNTPENLEKLIKKLTNENYEFVTISKLLKK